MSPRLAGDMASLRRSATVGSMGGRGWLLGKHYNCFFMCEFTNILSAGTPPIPIDTAPWDRFQPAHWDRFQTDPGYFEGFESRRKRERKSSRRYAASCGKVAIDAATAMLH